MLDSKMSNLDAFENNSQKNATASTYDFTIPLPMNHSTPLSSQMPRSSVSKPLRSLPTQRGIGTHLTSQTASSSQRLLSNPTPKLRSAVIDMDWDDDEKTRLSTYEIESIASSMSERGAKLESSEPNVSSTTTENLPTNTTQSTQTIPPNTPAHGYFTKVLIGVLTAALVSIAFIYFFNRSGTIKVHVNLRAPNGTKVSVALNGVDKCGDTFCQLEDVKPGKHVIKATAGHVEKRQSIYVKAGQEVSVDFSLELDPKTL